MIDELNDKIECKMCGNKYYICTMNMHIHSEHNISASDYNKKYYNIKISNIGCSEAIFISKIRELYPQFNSDLELFQFLYDVNGNSYKNLIKKFKYPKIKKICQCLGIQINYNLTEQHKQKISQKHKGKTLTKEHKEKISEGYKNLSKEKKEEISKKISEGNKGKTYSKESIEKMIKNRKDEKHPFRGKAGKREDLNNQYFRSTWEANYARILKYLNVEYQFEPDIIWLKRPNGTEISYRPDFKVGDLYIEIKGYWYGDAVEKMKMLKEQYPEIKVKVIDAKTYNRLVKFYKKKIQWWE